MYLRKRAAVPKFTEIQIGISKILMRTLVLKLAHS